MHLQRWFSLIFSIGVLKNCKECMVTELTLDTKAKGSNDDYEDDGGK